MSFLYDLVVRMRLFSAGNFFSEVADFSLFQRFFSFLSIGMLAFSDELYKK